MPVLLTNRFNLLPGHFKDGIGLFGNDKEIALNWPRLSDTEQVLKTALSSAEVKRERNIEPVHRNAISVWGGSNVGAASGICTPLWIFHGAEDGVVPVRLSKNMYDEMIRRGNKTVRYTEYPGVKHNSWENVSHEKTLAR